MLGTWLNDWFLESQVLALPDRVVYRAQHRLDDARLARVVVLAPELLRPEQLATLPADLLGFHRLNHPNVASYYDAGTLGPQGWYATEWCEGQPLHDRALEPGGKPGAPVAELFLSLAVQTARAMKHAHLRSLLQRLVLPQRALLLPDGVLKWVDYGLEKIIPMTPFEIDSQAGKLQPFMFQPPEVFQGKPFSKRSDLYSLGCFYYWLATGRPVFTANHLSEFTQKHCFNLPERPIALVPSLPRDLDELICALLQKDPNRRPASAAIVIDELDQIRAQLERRGTKVVWPAEPSETMLKLEATTVTSSPQEVSPAGRTLMSRPFVVLPLFLVVVGLILWLSLRPRPTADELFTQAQPLLQSNNPDDWDRAWDDYLSPLRERYPDAYHEEIATAKRKISLSKDLLRSIDQAKRAAYTSEAERLYATGLKLLQAGDTATARRLWSHIQAFDSLPEERSWIDAANAALEATADLPTAQPTSNKADATLQRLLILAKQWQADNRNQEAEQLLQQLRWIYRDDPTKLNLIQNPPSTQP